MPLLVLSPTTEAWAMRNTAPAVFCINAIAYYLLRAVLHSYYFAVEAAIEGR
jgi:hypothetical protein